MMILNKRSKSEFVVYFIAFVILSSVALSYVLVFLWGFLASLKTHSELLLYPFELPQNWKFINLIDAFTMLEVRGTNMFGMIGNTLWLVATGPFLNLFGSTLLAYAVTKYKFKGANLLISINVVVMILPIIGALPATYRLYSSLGFIDSPLLLIVYIGSFGADFLFMRACFKNISWEYAEAGIMDGAGHYLILFKIMLPLAKGTFLALLLLRMVAVWNDEMTALLFLPNMPTLSTGIYLFNIQMIYRARMDILLSATMLSAIPPLFVFIFFNKAMLTNITIGGLKG